MKKILGCLFIGLGVFLFGVFQTPYIAKFRDVPNSTLIQERSDLSVKIYSQEILDKEAGGVSESGPLKWEKFYYNAELYRRIYFLDWIGLSLSFIGLFLICADLFQTRFRPRSTNVD